MTVENEKMVRKMFDRVFDRVYYGAYADDKEPLIEKLSTFWVRMNLRAAKAREMRPAEIEILTYYSAKYYPVSFTRQNVYNFCMKLEGIDREKMKAAAEKVLDENWLPSHSEQYRNTYHPAYRVVYKDYKKVYSLKDLEDEVQKITDRFIKDIDKAVEEKSKEIMTV